MDMSTVTSYTVWYQISVEEAGSYSFCTNNNGSVDTKGWLYSASDTSSYLAYNDDYGVGKDLPTGYKYDFGFIVDLEAGTYVLKVTYSIYSSNTATELNLNVIKN